MPSCSPWRSSRTAGSSNDDFDVDDSRPTPSHTDYDGIDRVPAHPAVLFGHHFSSIAGAGPIVGPIVAALAFGWAFPLAWVLLGAIFIGGVHDFSALIASVRNRARSVADIARESLSPLAYRLLMLFMWLALVYVLTVFTDLTATTFVQDGGVATSSWMFLGLALAFRGQRVSPARTRRLGVARVRAARCSSACGSGSFGRFLRRRSATYCTGNR